MTSDNKEIDRIIEKYKELFEALETYDKTGILPKLNKQDKKPVSKIIKDEDN